MGEAAVLPQYIYAYSTYVFHSICIHAIISIAYRIFMKGQRSIRSFVWLCCIRNFEIFYTYLHKRVFAKSIPGLWHFSSEKAIAQNTTI